MPCCVLGKNKETSVPVYSVGNPGGLLPTPNPSTNLNLAGRLQCLGTCPLPPVGVVGPWRGEINFLFLARASHFHFALDPPDYLARAASR